MTDLLFNESGMNSVWKLKVPPKVKSFVAGMDQNGTGTYMGRTGNHKSKNSKIRENIIFLNIFYYLKKTKKFKKYEK